MKESGLVVYWDSSALLSVLCQDSNSEEALQWSQRDGAHFFSSLSYAEVYAVLARLQRERLLIDLLLEAACEVLESGPWRKLTISPSWEKVQSLAWKWPLRGADLWHLAMAKRLQEERPELILLTFDARLRAAARGESLSVA